MEFRRRRAGAILLAFSVTILLYSSCMNLFAIPLLPYNVLPISSSEHNLELPRYVETANATLGFGAIAAVSHSSSPRRKGLLAAAYITDLNITIPEQPIWTDDDLNNLRHPTESTISRGSALAWLGHLNVLRYFLNTNLDTILILEDDVDWDIHLRSFQIPYIAAIVRTLISRVRSQDSYAVKLTYESLIRKQNFISTASAGGYWGHTSDWDIMYLGHCGDHSPASDWSGKSASPPPAASFSDPSLPVLQDLDASTQRFFSDLYVPSQTRLVHKSVSPLCTFGYAVTRQAAERILYDKAAREHDGGCVAYDVLILEMCRDQGFRCWTVNPEVFHHQKSASMIEAIDGAARVVDEKQRVDEGDVDGAHEMSEGGSSDNHDLNDSATLSADGEPAVTRAGHEEETKESLSPDATPNIQCGARNKAFFSENRHTLDYFRKVIAEGVQCSRESRTARGGDGG